MTNGYLAAIAQAGTLPVPEGRVSSMITAAEPGKLLFTMSPLFHFMGLLKLVNPIYFATPFVLSPDRPLTADLLSQIIHDTNPRTGAFPPSLLQELSASELGIKCLSHFDMIVYGGAPLAREAGDRITQLTHLQSVLGSSECGLLGSLKHQDRNDWGYIEWNPEHGIEMQSIGDGLYELVVPRGDNWRAHSVFHVFPDKEEFRTGDLFVPHEKKKGLWIYNGRKDDVIVLNNGEKFNPTSMEAIIASHPFIARAVVIGQGRFQSAALIVPDWSAWQGSPDALIDAIWPVVKKANDSALGHARLMRDRIGVTSREKPFKLTPKGTIQRRVILADYAGEIDGLYAENDQGGNIAQIAKDASLADVERYVSSTISDILGVSALDRNADIFAMGFDSLQTLRLGQTLQGALKTAHLDLPQGAFGSQQIYARPTVAKIGQYILSLLQGDDSITAATTVESDNARAERLDGLVRKYTSGLCEGHAVIITGSTGSLGSYLLSELLQDSSVTRIYCLNRSADAAPRQLKSLQEKGLANCGEFPRRVEFLQASFGERRLGLDETKYEELLREVDTIIHNAWKVNFNHRVEAFEDTHIEGVRRLVELSIASQRRAHIHFVSSVSAIAGYSPEKGPSIPEVIFDDPTVPLRQGYGESKHVSERICATASTKCGIPTSIHRVGQIGGPTTANGMWNKQEWLPSLVATSKALGKIPTSLGSVSVRWVPVVCLSLSLSDIIAPLRVLITYTLAT